MKFLKETEEKVLETREDLGAYLDSIKDDVWDNPFVRDCACVSIDPATPILWPLYNNELSYIKHGIKQTVKPLDLEDENVRECIESGTGVFFIYPAKTREVLPSYTRAFIGMCQRAGDECATMTRFEAKPTKSVLPIGEKVKRLTNDFELSSERCIVLKRWGKVMAVHSQFYVPLPMNDLISILEDTIGGDHPEYEFADGIVNNDYLMANYNINDEMMEESFRLSLNDAGRDVKSVKAGISFISSDTASSAVRASCFYDVDGVRITLGKPVYIAHKGEADMNKVRSEFSNLGSVFKENEELIENLGNIEINDVGGVILKIKEKYSFMPKDLTEKVALEYKGAGTAIDVYLALNELIQLMNSTLNTYLSNRETVERMLNLPFEKIDRDEEWQKV